MGFPNLQKIDQVWQQGRSKQQWSWLRLLLTCDEQGRPHTQWQPSGVTGYPSQMRFFTNVFPIPGGVQLGCEIVASEPWFVRHTPYKDCLPPLQRKICWINMVDQTVLKAA